MDISLKNKHALVGGSSDGIGKAIAIQLAESGATVTLMARNPNKLQKVLEELPVVSGQKHQFLVVDFTDFIAFRDTIDNFFDNHSIDILVNNTQGPTAGGVLEKVVDDYQHAFDLLFKCAVHTTHLALQGMKEKSWGRIINVASVSVKEPLTYLALSNTIRAALVTWAKTLATEVGASGITVNSVLTGYFDTERLQQLNSSKAEKMKVPIEEVKSTMESQTAVRRIGKPEEYGFLVAFLASDKAAYLTGTAIPLDGGYLRSL